MTHSKKSDLTFAWYFVTDRHANGTDVLFELFASMILSSLRLQQTALLYTQDLDIWQSRRIRYVSPWDVGEENSLDTVSFHLICAA
mmetsp:Transcript_1174/g.1362  ORF Transcript_1174/g.1362 Transcript_1174/m.1362 type:complete len:86 (-) Transcript_1174:1337-1594(-)